MKKDIHFIIEYGNLRICTNNLLKDGKKFAAKIRFKDKQANHEAHIALTLALKVAFENLNVPILDVSQETPMEFESNILISEVDKRNEACIKDNLKVSYLMSLPLVEEINIIWDDIFFEKDKIIINLNRLHCYLKPIVINGIFESLNQIKNEYFTRIYPKKLYKIKIYKNEVLTNESVGWKEILNSIELAKDYYILNMTLEKIYVKN